VVARLIDRLLETRQCTKSAKFHQYQISFAPKVGELRMPSA
jgi:hypothetical protein